MDKGPRSLKLLTKLFRPLIIRKLNMSSCAVDTVNAIKINICLTSQKNIEKNKFGQSLQDTHNPYNQCSQKIFIVGPPYI